MVRSHGFGQSPEEGVPGWGGMGHRVINHAHTGIHQGFFHGKQKHPSPLVLICV